MKALISIPKSQPSPLERACFARVRAAVSAQAAEKVYPDDRAVASILTRADQTIGTTGTSGWASQVAPNVVGEFMAALAPLSAAARLIAAGMQVPIPATAVDDEGNANSISIPSRSGAPVASTTSWVAEGAPIQVTKWTLNADCVLTPKKFAMLTVFSRELAKRADGEAVIRTLLREDAAATLDASYFSATAVSSAAHPGLLNGVTAIAGFPGGDRDTMTMDLAALSDAVSDGGSGQVMFITSPKRAARIPILWPEIEATFLASLAVADDVVIAVDPLSIVHGFGDFDIDVSTEATIHMENSNPLEIVSAAGTVADPTLSMYQHATVSLRLIADVAFAKRRSNAVAWLSAATW